MMQRCVVRDGVLSKNPQLCVFHFLFSLIVGYVMLLTEVSKPSVEEEVEAGEFGGSSRSHISSWEGTCILAVFLCDISLYLTRHTQHDRSPLNKGGVFHDLSVNAEADVAHVGEHAGFSEQEQADLCTFTTISSHC